MQPAIFIDRDNTLIANEGDLGDPQRVKLFDDVATGLASLRDAGYRLVVITNQAGVARGKFSEHDVDAVHQRIADMVDIAAKRHGLIDRFYYCPYHPEGTVEEYRRDHPWRKPHPGMLLQAARDMGLDLSRSWMIGDKDRDVTAGRAAGCRTILISKDAKLVDAASPTFASTSFADAARVVLGHPPATPEKVAAGPTHNSEPSPADAARRGSGGVSLEPLRRSMQEMTDELRTSRMRRAEFTPAKAAAALCQLLVLLLAMLGLLQISDSDAFLKWIAGAVLVQLVTITLLVFDAGR